jgi:nicotinamide mononucleotide transporter
MHDAAILLSSTLDGILAYAAANRLEALGAVAGLACVGLLIRQSMWNWPLGIAYSGISVYLFAQAPLYGQVVLNSYFLLMNLYGWMVWLRHGKDGEAPLQVSRTSSRTLAIVLGLAALGVLLLGTLFDQFTASRFPLADVGITLLSTAAMWLQARKKLESWVFWFVVNLASVGLFVATENYFYVLLYAIYVPMAVEGHISWRRSMVSAAT